VLPVKTREGVSHRSDETPNVITIYQYKEILEKSNTNYKLKISKANQQYLYRCLHFPILSFDPDLHSTISDHPRSSFYYPTHKLKILYKMSSLQTMIMLKCS